MSDEHLKLGARGERLAEQFLLGRRFKFVARHYSTPVGELDLVMLDGRSVVFVEVKTRGDDRWAEPADAVNNTKQKRLARAAAWFLNHRRMNDRPCRFDVVAVILPPAGEPRVGHFVEAFIPER